MYQSLVTYTYLAGSKNWSYCSHTIVQEHACLVHITEREIIWKYWMLTLFVFCFRGFLAVQSLTLCMCLCITPLKLTSLREPPTCAVAPPLVFIRLNLNREIDYITFGICAIPCLLYMDYSVLCEIVREQRSWMTELRYTVINCVQVLWVEYFTMTPMLCLFVIKHCTPSSREDNDSRRNFEQFLKRLSTFMTTKSFTQSASPIQQNNCVPGLMVGFYCRWKTAGLWIIMWGEGSQRGPLLVRYPVVSAPNVLFRSLQAPEYRIYMVNQRGSSNIRQYALTNMESWIS